MGKVTTFASANIPLTLDTFLRHQPQTTALKLFKPFKGSNSSVAFSVSYLSYINMCVLPALNPSKNYAYLTYDPPLQPNTQEVFLMCRGLDKNGTIYDPSKNHERTEETQLKKCGPTGLTEIYYIYHSIVIEDKYFFYIKSIGYTRKVTLNLATSPEKVSTENHEKYFLLDNNSNILVNASSTTLALFPIKLLLSSESVSISISQITSENIIKNVNLSPDYKPQPPTNDEFIYLLNYITKDPNGIAEKSIIDTSGYMVKYSDDQVNSYRFEITAGKCYSLNNSFKYNFIEDPVKEVILTFGVISTGHLKFHFLSCNRGGGEMNALKVGTFEDKDSVLCNLYSDDIKGIQTDDYLFCLRSDKIDKNAKFVAFFTTSALISGVKRKHGGFVVNTTWDQEATCRVVDNITRKELMCLKT